MKLNKKLYKASHWQNKKTLKPEDILGMIKGLIKINQGCEH